MPVKFVVDEKCAAKIHTDGNAVTSALAELVANAIFHTASSGYISFHLSF